MAGIHSGVQQRFKDVNAKAEFVACNNHSLNLRNLYECSWSVCELNDFFAAVEKVFTFFSASTHRWDILKKFVPITVKRVVETR